MDTKIILVALLALIVGTGGGYAIAGSRTPDMGEHMMDTGEHMSDGDMTEYNHSMGMNSAMDDMTGGLAGKTGDEFDKAFIAEMIMHHEGAVEMASAALINAEHDEIKVMAEAIIEAQTIEIEQLQDWQAAWYGN